MALKLRLQGPVNTDLWRNDTALGERFKVRLFFPDTPTQYCHLIFLPFVKRWMKAPVEMGAYTQLFAGASVEGVQLNGKVSHFPYSYMCTTGGETDVLFPFASA